MAGRHSARCDMAAGIGAESSHLKQAEQRTGSGVKLLIISRLTPSDTLPPAGPHLLNLHINGGPSVQIPKTLGAILPQTSRDLENLTCFKDNSMAGRRFYTKGGDTSECSVPSMELDVVTSGGRG